MSRCHSPSPPLLCDLPFKFSGVFLTARKGIKLEKPQPRKLLFSRPSLLPGCAPGASAVRARPGLPTSRSFCPIWCSRALLCPPSTSFWMPTDALCKRFRRNLRPPTCFLSAPLHLSLARCYRSRCSPQTGKSAGQSLPTPGLGSF